MGRRAASRRVVVVGLDAAAVGRSVSELRAQGLVVAGFVGEDEALARQMANEMVGGADEVVSADERRGPAV